MLLHAPVSSNPADLQQRTTELEQYINYLEETFDLLQIERSQQVEERTSEIKRVMNYLQRIYTDRPPIPQEILAPLAPIAGIPLPMAVSPARGGEGKRTTMPLKRQMELAQHISSIGRHRQSSKDRAWQLIWQKLPTWLHRARTRASDRASDQTVLSMAEADQRAGRKLTNLQHNLLVLEGKVDRSVKYTCDVCYSEDLTLDEVVFLGCKHFCCRTCTEAQMVTKIKGAEVQRIKCLHSACQYMATFVEVRHVLPVEEFARYNDFLLNEALKTESKISWCVRPGCSTPVINESGSPMVRCPKESCRFAYCSQCKIEWHNDVTCEKYQEWKELNAKAGDLFEEWRKSHTKPCPKCNANIEKNGGCNHMTCVSCRYEFCWLCMKVYKSGHFTQQGPCNGKQFT